MLPMELTADLRIIFPESAINYVAFILTFSFLFSLRVHRIKYQLSEIIKVVLNARSGSFLD